MKILIAINDVIDEYYIVEFCAETIFKKDDQIIIAKVFVQPGVPINDYYPGPIILTEDYIFESYQSQKIYIESLRTLAEKIYENYSIKVEVKLLDPHQYMVGEAIAIYSQKINADMIILGSRKMSALKKFFIGSTSKYVAHNTKISVTICPPPLSHNK
ncbi:hypothetical protein MXB_4317 [Myxobolus squamalis]|nr:hypothetical protein MXB_4317 [Myxobolus squamalis]